MYSTPCVVTCLRTKSAELTSLQSRQLQGISDLERRNLMSAKRVLMKII